MVDQSFTTEKRGAIAQVEVALREFASSWQLSLRGKEPTKNEMREIRPYFEYFLHEIDDTFIRDNPSEYQLSDPDYRAELTRMIVALQESETKTHPLVPSREFLHTRCMSICPRRLTQHLSKQERIGGLTDVIWQPEPFGSGACRDCYLGLTYSVWTGSRAAHWDKYAVVVKRARNRSTDLGDWKDMELSSIAKTFAKYFNWLRITNILIDFSFPVLSVVGEPSLYSDFLEGEIVLVEKYIDGEFVKANSNTGWTGWCGGSYNKEKHQVAQAFSHWTYHVSGGRYLVCDLQGGKGPGVSWMFTDPAIHTRGAGKKLGKTDLGTRGINKFFEGHVCNKYCRGLKKPDVLIVDTGLPAVRATSTINPLHCENVSRAVHLQKGGGTCYGYAISTVIRAAEMRIVGRQPESFDAMVQQMIRKHGSDGGYDAQVLKEECLSRGLRFAKVPSARVSDIVTRERRPLICQFNLCENQWDAFSDFFKNRPVDTLRSLPPADRSKKEGHSVVVVGCTEDVLYIKNSWGDDWADKGYFSAVQKVLDVCVPASYFDVFWIETDLTDDERKAYAESVRRSPPII